MFERILERMRRLVREGQYVVTMHGVEAMEDDELTVWWPSSRSAGRAASRF